MLIMHQHQSETLTGIEGNFEELFSDRWPSMNIVTSIFRRMLIIDVSTFLNPFQEPRQSSEDPLYSSMYHCPPASPARLLTV